MDRLLRIQRVQDNAFEFAAFERENKQFKDSDTGRYIFPQDHVFQAGSLTLRVVAHKTAACGECAFYAHPNSDSEYCRATYCTAPFRKDGATVIFITDEDLLKLKMRGEL